MIIYHYRLPVCPATDLPLSPLVLPCSVFNVLNKSCMFFCGAMCSSTFFSARGGSPLPLCHNSPWHMGSWTLLTDLAALGAMGPDLLYVYTIDGLFVTGRRLAAGGGPVSAHSSTRSPGAWESLWLRRAARPGCGPSGSGWRGQGQWPGALGRGWLLETGMGWGCGGSLRLCSQLGHWLPSSTHPRELREGSSPGRAS